MDPLNTDKHHSPKMLDDEKKLSMNQPLPPTPMDFSANSVNDDFLMEPNINKTFFRSLNSSVIITQVGSIVQLPCRVHLIGDEMVWT